MRLITYIRDRFIILFRPDCDWEANTTPALAFARDFAYYLAVYVFGMYVMPFAMPADYGEDDVQSTAAYALSFAVVSGLVGALMALMANERLRNRRSFIMTVISTSLVYATVVLILLALMLGGMIFAGDEADVSGWLALSYIFGAIFAPIGWRYFGLDLAIFTAEIGPDGKGHFELTGQRYARIKFVPQANTTSKPRKDDGR